MAATGLGAVRQLWGAEAGGPSRPGLDLRGRDLAGQDLSGRDLHGADLTEADLAGANLTGADLTGARLVGARLDGVKANRVRLDGADLSECSARGARLGAASLRRAVLQRANLEGASLVAADLRGADACSAILRKARLREADLRGAVFDRADLHGADLVRARVAGAAFDGANLGNAALRGLQGFARARWIGVDVRGVNWTGALLLRRHIDDENYLWEFRRQGRGAEWIYRLWWITSDCGRGIGRWMAWNLALALLFAIFYSRADVDWGPRPTALSPLYFSLVTLTTLGYGDIRPVSTAAQAAVMVQVLLGYVGLGGLMAIIANRMARRAD